MLSNYIAVSLHYSDYNNDQGLCGVFKPSCIKTEKDLLGYHFFLKKKVSVQAFC